jgi:Spy/CpxP family protein refolding chaperone
MTSKITTGAIAIFFAGAMLAQTQFGPRGANGSGSGTPPDPATIIANQVARLTTLLDLTSDQASQATTILTAAQSSVSTLQTTIETDRTSLQTAITSNNMATIDQLSAAIGNLQGQALDIRSKAEAAFYALLTTTQQTKLTTLGGIGLLGGPGGYPGRGGPGGPRP